MNTIEEESEMDDRWAMDSVKIEREQFLKSLFWDNSAWTCVEVGRDSERVMSEKEFIKATEELLKQLEGEHYEYGN